MQKYENDWIVDVLDQSETYDLDYNYFQCGICRLCKDERCFELAHYLCQLDFVIVDIMGMKLKHTMILTHGDEYCDFKYSQK